MFCPSCGSEERQVSQFCRACGLDMRAVRVTLEKPDAITASAVSARDEIGHAIAVIIALCRYVGTDAKLVAADAAIHHRDLVAMERLQTARQHVGPAIVAIHGRGGAVGDGVAEGHDGERISGCGHLNGIEEEPGCRSVGECRLVLQRTLGAGAGCAVVGGGECLGVPGHWAAVAGDMEADREPAAGKFVRLLCEWQRDRVAPCRASGRD